MKEEIQVFDNVLQLIGKTPLIHLNRITANMEGEFLCKS
jgi:cystathionine beta-synthase